MPNIVYAGGGKPEPNPENEIWGDEEFLGLLNRSSALTQLPPSIKNVRTYAFYKCSNLSLTELPEGVTSIGGSAFANCYGIKSLSIGSAIQTIGTNAFNYCANLTSITINRVKDAISGAPWGATGATITWTGIT